MGEIKLSSLPTHCPLHPRFGAFAFCPLTRFRFDQVKRAQETTKNKRFCVSLDTRGHPIAFLGRRRFPTRSTYVSWWSNQSAANGRGAFAHWSTTNVAFGGAIRRVRLCGRCTFAGARGLACFLRRPTGLSRTRVLRNVRGAVARLAREGQEQSRPCRPGVSSATANGVVLS